MGMGILKKEKAPENLDTLIGHKTVFEGVLMSNESVCIEGTVKGKVECRGSVVVGQGGKVKADIIAENAFIGGQVTGNIKAKNRLEISSTRKVKGDIETASQPIAGIYRRGDGGYRRARTAVAVSVAGAVGHSDSLSRSQRADQLPRPQS